MKTIILAGGLGTRISEETTDKPKPMIMLNGKPILWHVMSIFAKQGFTDFVVAAGYKAKAIEEWAKNSDLGWNITVIDTGLATQTGGRVRKCLEMYQDERFFVTYGDGLANVNLTELLSFHISHGKSATVTAVRPPARFGVIQSENGLVVHFGEKLQADAGWINGGFFILEKSCGNFVESDSEPFEAGPISRLVQENELMAFQHYKFWQPMDTLREKQELEKLSLEALPPWLDL